MVTVCLHILLFNKFFIDLNELKASSTYSLIIKPLCRNISRFLIKSIQVSLDILQTRGEISSLNVYFLQESVEITKEVIDNKDDLTNNDKFNAPGPSLNDEVKLLKNPQSLSSQFK